MKHIDNQIEQKSSASDARRKFLVKASATSLVATLPIRTSWASGSSSGCTVSGNLSGNLSRDCEVMLNGKSPGGWHTNFKPTHRKYNSEPVPERDSAGCKWDAVFGGIDVRPPFTVPMADVNAELWWFLPNVGIAPYSPGGGDESSNLDTALVAAYLNAKSGRYGALTVSAEQYVQGLHDQVTSGQVSWTEMKAAIESTY